MWGDHQDQLTSVELIVDVLGERVQHCFGDQILPRQMAESLVHLFGDEAAEVYCTTRTGNKLGAELLEIHTRSFELEITDGDRVVATQVRYHRPDINQELVVIEHPHSHAKGHADFQAAQFRGNGYVARLVLGLLDVNNVGEFFARIDLGWDTIPDRNVGLVVEFNSTEGFQESDQNVGFDMLRFVGSLDIPERIGGFSLRVEEMKSQRITVYCALNKEIPVDPFLLVVVEDDVVGLNLHVHNFGGFADRSLQEAVEDFHFRGLPPAVIMPTERIPSM